jgi:DnaJ-class molecular chaperone
MLKQFYQILECNPNATPDEIRKAWRKKCREHHPDLGGEVNKFLQITHAYKMITDPSYQQQAKGSQIKDLTFRIQIAIDFLEAFYGTRITINYNRIYLDHKYEQIKDDNIEPISISVEIPPGSTRGMEYKSKDMGIVCGHQRGDAVVKIDVRRHPRYTCADIDVYCDEEVPLDVMLKGGEITVDTLWGHKVIWIPPGTRPGDKIRIYESGVQKKGYQYSTIKPIFPNSQDLRKDAWRGLNINWEQAEVKNKEDDELMAKFDSLRNPKNG